MSEIPTQVVEAVAITNEGQMVADSEAAVEASQFEALKQLMGTSADSVIKSIESKVAPVDVSPEAKLAEFKKEIEPVAEEAPKEAPKVEDAPKAVNPTLEFKQYLETLENTKVLHKIDGQMVEVDFKEAAQKVLNEYAGHQTVDKRFTELDKRDKQVYSREEAQKQVLENFSKFKDAGDILGGYQYIGALTGTPKHLITEQLIAALTPEIERRYALSNQDLEYERLLQEKEYLSERVEAESRQRKQEQSFQELRATVTSLRETHNIDEESWDKAFEELDGIISQGQPITPDMVVDRVKLQSVKAAPINMTANVVSKYNLNAQDAKALDDIAKQYPNFTEADIDDLVKQSLNEASKKETETKLISKYAEQNKVPASDLEDEEAKEFLRLKKLVGQTAGWA